MAVDDKRLEDLYHHCGESMYDEFYQAYIADPVIGLQHDEEKAQEFLSYTGALTFFCALSGALGVLCIYMNITLFLHFYKRSSQVIPAIYTILASCDAVTGLAGIATSVTLGYLLTASPPTSQTHLLVSYNLTSLTVRFSVWISLALSLVRTVHIVKPHVVVRRWQVITPILVVFFLSVCLMVFSYIAESDAGQTNIWHRVRFNLIFTMTGKRIYLYVARKMCVVISKETLWTLSIIIPFVLPALISFVAMAIQVYYMAIKPGVSKKIKSNRRITVTIIYLTLVYVLVNTLYFLTTIMYVYVVQDMTPGISFALFVTSTILPFINSLANPLIIAIRGKSIRRHFKHMLRCKSFNIVDSDVLTRLGTVTTIQPISRKTSSATFISPGIAMTKNV